MRDLTSHAAALRRLTRTDGAPRVRHRADALLPLAHGRSGEDAAHARGCCTQRSRVWVVASWPQGGQDWPIGHDPAALPCWMTARGRYWRRLWRARRWPMATP